VRTVAAMAQFPSSLPRVAHNALGDATTGRLGFTLVSAAARKPTSNGRGG
jgi:hypothetical protein